MFVILQFDWCDLHLPLTRLLWKARVTKSFEIPRGTGLPRRREGDQWPSRNAPPQQGALRDETKTAARLQRDPIFGLWSKGSWSSSWLGVKIIEFGCLVRKANIWIHKDHHHRVSSRRRPLRFLTTLSVRCHRFGYFPTPVATPPVGVVSLSTLPVSVAISVFMGQSR